MIIAIAVLLTLPNDISLNTKKENSFPVKPETPFIKIDYSKLRDTVYTFKDYWIEVNVKTQTGLLHSRDGSVFEFKLSTGTNKIKDGLLTKDGLYAIQSMMPKWHSRQFDSTLLLYWMGFNYGIGFHGLLGNTYYKFLGVKPSSHGCVRIAREDGEKIYEKVSFGVPVLVHNENNAITIGFADEESEYNYYSFSELHSILKKRYESLYTGKYFLEVNEKIMIDKENVHHPGLPIGNSEKISTKQKTKNFTTENIESIQDKLFIKDKFGLNIKDSIIAGINN